MNVTKILRFRYDPNKDGWERTNLEWSFSASLTPNQIRFSPPTPLVPGGDKKLLVLVSCTISDSESKIIYLDNDSTHGDYVSKFSGETFNGFGIFQDTFLVIASEIVGTSQIRTFKILDDDGVVNPPPYSSTQEFAFDLDTTMKPKGLRISPYDTVVVGIESSTEKRIDEYRLIPLKAGDYAFRRVVRDESSEALVVNDFALTHDRMGMEKSLLRIFLTDIAQNGSTITCNAWGENTSSAITIVIQSWETYLDDNEDPLGSGDKNRKYLPGAFDEDTPLQELTWTGIPSGDHVLSVKYIGDIGQLKDVDLAKASFSITV